MRVSKTVDRALLILRKRVLLESAALRLPTTPSPGDDTPAIREALRLYTQSWVLPIIEAVRRGRPEDMDYLKRLI